MSCRLKVIGISLVILLSSGYVGLMLWATQAEATCGSCSVQPNGIYNQVTRPRQLLSGDGVELRLARHGQEGSTMVRVLHVQEVRNGQAL